jgi:molecular chaperone Hsp33
MTTPTPPAGVRIRGLVAGGAVRILLVEAHGPADEVRRRHALDARAARLTAETMVAAALLAAHLKGNESITVQIQGENPRISIYVDHTAEGDLRARTTPSHPQGEGPLEGLMLTIKALDGREVYRGITPLHGSIEAGLGQHLAESNQVDAILRLHVRVDPNGRVAAAGGVLFERLASEAGQPTLEPEAFEESLGDLRSVDAGALLTELAFGSLHGEPVNILEHQVLNWSCRCSRERVATMLLGLGEAEIRAMIAEDGGAEITCHFCNEVYRFDDRELAGLLPS